MGGGGGGGGGRADTAKGHDVCYPAHDSDRHVAYVLAAYLSTAIESAVLSSRHQSVSSVSASESAEHKSFAMYSSTSCYRICRLAA